MSKAFNNSDFIKLPLLIKGKVRNVYDLGENLLMLSTDRISAFDVVFDDLIPDKGRVLTGISEFWFDYTKDIVPNHVVSTEVNDFPEQLHSFSQEISGRTMLTKKLKMIEAECVVRGYLEGSGLKEYKREGSICGIKLPAGLKQADKLEEPIFTPSTKAHTGHDENVSFDFLEQKIGKDLARRIRDISINLYIKASKHTESKGIILADTKFEFGMIDGELILADEIFTPDSSRFWNKYDYEPGRAQKSFDKQYLRDYLEGIDWNKQPPAPALPADVIENTRSKYIEAYEKISGQKFNWK
jgi:phosphoribosylaminoimidazole-succinocarboxamide synthase